MNNINKLHKINGDIKWNANSFEKLLKVKLIKQSLKDLTINISHYICSLKLINA